MLYLYLYERINTRKDLIAKWHPLKTLGNGEFCDERQNSEFSFLYLKATLYFFVQGNPGGGIITFFGYKKVQ